MSHVITNQSLSIHSFIATASIRLFTYLFIHLLSISLCIYLSIGARRGIVFFFFFPKGEQRKMGDNRKKEKIRKEKGQRKENRRIQLIRKRRKKKRERTSKGELKKIADKEKKKRERTTKGEQKKIADKEKKERERTAKGDQKKKSEGRRKVIKFFSSFARKVGKLLGRATDVNRNFGKHREYFSAQIVFISVCFILYIFLFFLFTF